MPEIRVLLADDHGVLRAGLRALLEAESEVRIVGEASTGEEAVDQTRLVQPDIVLMDINMPGIGGLEATRQIVALGQHTGVLVMTMHEPEDYLLPALEAGARGYVRKTSADENLMSAIRTVARGDVFLYPHAAKLLLRGYRLKHDPTEPPQLRPLTARERDVLALTASGFSSREIGEKLFISPKTVDTYRGRVMDKLKLRHRSELVRVALETRLLKL